jgi:hypothetical protein
MSSAGLSGMPASMTSDAISGAGMEPGAGYEGYGAGPTPGAVNDMKPGDINSVLGSMSLMRRMALLFGKDTEEQVKNINAFSSTVKDVGNTVSKMGETTLMQRMMEAASKGGIQFLGEGKGPASGGIAAIPKTFDPSLASHIMNHQGYK